MTGSSTVSLWDWHSTLALLTKILASAVRPKIIHKSISILGNKTEKLYQITVKTSVGSNCNKVILVQYLQMPSVHGHPRDRSFLLCALPAALEQTSSLHTEPQHLCLSHQPEKVIIEYRSYTYSIHHIYSNNVNFIYLLTYLFIFIYYYYYSF